MYIVPFVCIHKDGFTFEIIPKINYWSKSKEMQIWMKVTRTENVIGLKIWEATICLYEMKPGYLKKPTRAAECISVLL